MKPTCKKMWLNLSWASLIVKDRWRLKPISLLCSIFTVFKHPSPPPPDRLFATTRGALLVLRVAVILLASMSISPRFLTPTKIIKLNFWVSPPSRDQDCTSSNDICWILCIVCVEINSSFLFLCLFLVEISTNNKGTCLILLPFVVCNAQRFKIVCVFGVFNFNTFSSFRYI